MAITYHSGRRIQGLSTDTFPTFEDDFDNSDNWTSSGSTISITGNKVVANTVTGSTDRIYWDATHVALSDTKWVATFNYKVSVVGVDSEHTPLAFSAGTDQIRTSSQDYLGFDVYGQSSSPTRNVRLNYRDGTSNGYSSSTITPTLDRQYYCTMTRDGATLTLSLFTDEARTTHETGSPISITNVPSTVVGLNIAQITAWNGSASNSSWEVDTLKIYNGVTTIPTKPTNIQVGSRFEETDTRKMYYYESPSVTYTGDMSTGWTTGNAGSGFTLDGTNDEIDFLNNYGNDNVAIDLNSLVSGSISTSKWFLRFAIQMSGTASGDNIIWWNGVSSDASVEANSTAQSFIGSGNQTINGTAATRTYISMCNNERLDSSTVQNRLQLGGSDVSDFTGKYYFEIIRDGSNFTVNQYSDAYTTLYGSRTNAVSNEAGGTLRYFISANYQQGSNVTGTLSDFNFYDGVTSPDTAWKELGT